MSVLSLIFGGCRKDNPSKNTGTEFNLTSFPLHIGSRWVYLNRDLYNGTADTMTISIVDMKEQANQITYKTEIKLHGNVIDSGQFIKSNNSLEYKEYDAKGTGYLQFGNFNFNFPIYKDAKPWAGPYSENDTFRVIGLIDSININNKKYRNAYSVKREYISSSRNSIVHLFIICPNIGIIYSNLNTNLSGIPAQKNNFSLISFE